MRVRIDPARRWATATRIAYGAALSAQALLVLYGLTCLVLVGGAWALRISATGAAAGLVIGLTASMVSGFTRRSPLILAGFTLTGAAMFGLYAAVLAAVTTIETVLTIFSSCLGVAAVYLLLRLVRALNTKTPVVIQEGHVA